MWQSEASVAGQMDATTRTAIWVEPLFGLCLGALGGALEGSLLADSLVQTILCGSLFGLVFGLFFAKRATSAGARSRVRRIRADRGNLPWRRRIKRRMWESREW